MYNKAWKDIIITRVKICMAVMMALAFYFVLAPVEQARAEKVPKGFIAIASPEDLADIVNDTTASYYLTKNIDMKNYGEWHPINSFSGTLEGNNHSISNLTINATDTWAVGLFASIEGTEGEAVVSNLNLKKVVIKAKDAACAGAICGWVNNARIENCYVDGTIESTGEKLQYQHVGGVAGSVGSNTVINRCVNMADISTVVMEERTDQAWVYILADCYAGGIAGVLSHDVGATESSIEITECYNKGKIVAKAVAHSNATKYSSKIKALAYAYAYAGGICGRAIGLSSGNTISINNSFNEGTVGSYAWATAKAAYGGANQTSEMKNATGGIAGSLFDAEIENVYSSGKIEQNGYCGGIIGEMGSSVSLKNCYFLSDNKKGINVSLNGVGNIDVSGCKAFNSNGMKKESNYKDWDFEHTWVRNSAVNNGYPVLRFSASLFQLEKPTVSVKAGTYNKKVTLKLQSTAEKAVIYYTTDGTIPTVASKKYTKPIIISKSTTVKAIVIAGDFKDSKVTTAKYVIK